MKKDPMTTPNKYALQKISITFPTPQDMRIGHILGGSARHDSAEVMPPVDSRVSRPFASGLTVQLPVPPLPRLGWRERRVFPNSDSTHSSTSIVLDTLARRKNIFAEEKDAAENAVPRNEVIGYTYKESKIDSSSTIFKKPDLESIPALEGLVAHRKKPGEYGILDADPTEIHAKPGC